MARPAGGSEGLLTGGWISIIFGCIRLKFLATVESAVFLNPFPFVHIFFNIQGLLMQGDFTADISSLTGDNLWAIFLQL
jgi:hypothetical protein